MADVPQEKLEAKNYELIGKLQKKETKVPDDYETLLAFKQKKEQEDLEAKGKYNEATTALEQQYRERSAEDKATFSLGTFLRLFGINIYIRYHFSTKTICCLGYYSQLCIAEK